MTFASQDSLPPPARPSAPVQGLDELLARQYAASLREELREPALKAVPPPPARQSIPPSRAEVRTRTVEKLAALLARERSEPGLQPSPAAAPEGTPLALLDLDADLRVLRASPAAARMIGVVPAAATGQPLVALLRPEGPAALAASLSARLSRGEPVAQTFSCTTHDGRSAMIDWVCMPDLGADGALERVRVLLRDESGPTAALEALRTTVGAMVKPPRRPAAQAGAEPEPRRAVLRGELRLCYLPVFELASGRVRSFDVGARWDHPLLGALQPQQFLAAAQQAGGCGAFDAEVLEKALRQLEQWRRDCPDAASVTLDVTVSPEVLSLASLPRALLRPLAGPGRARGLSLRLPEALLGEGEIPAASLGALRATGAVFHVDRFGAGRAWLRHLRADGIEAVKLDGALLAASGSDRAVLRGLVGLARELGKQVVATFVESEAQLRLAREVGCHAAQGFHLSRPLDADAALALLRESTATACRQRPAAH